MSMGRGKGTSQARAREQHPRCPRCGYDVSGDCDRWKTQCPLEGTCPECGLRFEWRYLLNPALAAPSWLFDTNTTRFWGPLVKTLVRSLWPPGIAKALRIEQEFRLKRSLMLFGVCVLLVHVTAMVCGTALEIDNVYGLIRTGRGRLGFSQRPLFDTLLQVRAADFALPDGVAVKRLIWPYADLFDDPYVEVGDTPPWHIAWLWLVFIPLAFPPLTTTLRFARIRAAHIVRAACHIVPMIAIILWTHVMLGSWAFYLSSSRTPPWRSLRGRLFNFYESGASSWVCLGAIGIVLVWWWWRMVRRYMRLPHATAVTAGIVLMSFLAAVALTVYVVDPRMKTMFVPLFW